MGAGVAGFLGVGLGAFGAHGLRARLSPEMLAVFETGVRYQMYHVFAMLAAAWAFAHWQRREFVFAGWSFILGIVIFSGSLYALAFTNIHWLGAVTPIGGLLLLAGWLCLTWGAVRAKR